MPRRKAKRKSAMAFTVAFYVLPFAFALALASAGGCAVPQIAARVVYEDPTSFVRLEPDPSVLPDLPQTKHSHPATISSEDMALILRRLWVREHRNALQLRWSGLAQPEPVFQEEQIAMLAPRLSEALAHAQPNERVTFYLSHPQTSLKREVTSGGLYMRGSHLHFILGNYRIIYAIPAYGMVYDRRYPMMPTAPKAFDLLFEPPDAVVKQKVSLWDKIWAREKDEMVIDLRRVPAVVPVG